MAASTDLSTCTAMREAGGSVQAVQQIGDHRGRAIEIAPAVVQSGVGLDRDGVEIGRKRVAQGGKTDCGRSYAALVESVHGTGSGGQERSTTQKTGLRLAMKAAMPSRCSASRRSRRRRPPVLPARRRRRTPPASAATPMHSKARIVRLFVRAACGASAQIRCCARLYTVYRNCCVRHHLAQKTQLQHARGVEHGGLEQHLPRGSRRRPGAGPDPARAAPSGNPGGQSEHQNAPKLRRISGYRSNWRSPVPRPCNCHSIWASNGTSQSRMAFSAPHTWFSWKSRRCFGSNRNCAYSAISPPAQKCPSSPRTSTHRTNTSWRSCSNPVRNCCHITRDMALNRPGCDKVTTSSVSCDSKRTTPATCVRFLDQINMRR